MTYHVKGNNSCLDSIRADIAEMLNLQASKILHERTLIEATSRTPKQKIEGVQRAYSTISDRLTELLDKYNIT